MPQPSTFYEIELKAILSKEQYLRLYKGLHQKMKLINKDTIHTTRYKPGDIRLRYSNKIIEIVCKDGDPTKISRKEVKIPLASRRELEYFSQVLDLLNFQPDPSWTKHKREFEYLFKGFTYIVCLQNIENFAYILEVEFLSKTDDPHIHKPNFIKIIKWLGCEPINPEEFSNKIEKYIKDNKIK